MADDIGGLQVDFTAEASQLKAELQRMEQQLRAFDRAHGKQQVNLTARLSAPGQRAIADARRDIQRKLESDSGLLIRPRLAAPQTKELDTFAATLGRRIPAVTVKVKGVWDGWSTPPPTSVTVNVRGGGSGAASASTAVATPREATVRAPMGTTTPVRSTREENQRAREENRRAARVGAAAAAPAPRPQSAANRRAAQMSANQARAAAQTQTASRSEVFRDYTDQMLLEDYLDPNTGPGHRNKLAAELRSRGFTPPAPGASGGARGFASPVGARAPRLALPHWSAGPQPPSVARLRSMGRSGQLNQPGKDLYDPHADPPLEHSRLTNKGKRVWNTIGSPSGLPTPRYMESRWMQLAARVPSEMWKAQRPWLKESGQLIRDLSSDAGTGWSNTQAQGIAAELTNNASWPLTVQNFQESSRRWGAGARTSDEVFGKIGQPGSLAVAPRDRSKALAMMGLKDPTQEMIEKIIRTGAVNPHGKWTTPLKDVLAAPMPTKARDLSSAKIIQMFRGQMGDPEAVIPDRHVQRAIVHGELGNSSEALSSPIQEAGRRAARRMGMTPAEFMPPIWTMMAGGDPSFNADPFQMRNPHGAVATPREGPNIAAFTGSFGRSGQPFSQMGEAGGHIDPVTGTPTMGAMSAAGYMAHRELTASERIAREQDVRWNRQQAAQQRMFTRFGTGTGVGIAAFESTGQQPTPSGPAASPAKQASIDLKSLSSAARQVIETLERSPAYGQRLLESDPAVAAEIAAAQAKANAAAAAVGEKAPLKTAQEIAMQRVNRIVGGGDAADQQKAFLETSRTRTQEAAGVQQTLSLGRTIGSISAGLLGGNRDKRIIAQIKAMESAYERVGRAGREEFESLVKAETALERAHLQNAPQEDIDRLTESYNKAKEAAEPFTRAQEGVAGSLERLHNKINRPLAAIRGSFSALSGALIGGFVYSAAIDGITALAGALEKPVDAIGGYIGAGNRLQVSLGQTTRALHGHADLAVVAATAQAGLGDETYHTIAPILEQRAAVQAGNDAFGEQVDLIRAASLFRAQTRSAQRGQAFGFGITPGALPGISGATGGFFGSALGGQTPLIEQLAELTPQGTRGQHAAFGAAGGLAGLIGGALAGAAIGGIPTGGIGAIPGALIGGVGGLLGGAGLGGTLGPQLAGFSDIDLSGGRPSGGRALPGNRPEFTGRLAGFAGAANAASARAGGTTGLTEKELDHIENLRLAVSDLSEAAVRATPSLKGVTAAVDAGDAKAIAATFEAMKGWVNPDEAEALRLSGFAVTDSSGKALSRQELQQWFGSAQRGASIPTREQAVKSSIMPLAASLQLIQQQGQVQRQTMLPGQQYLNQLASGRAEVGGARAGGFGIRSLPSGGFSASGLPMRDIARTAPNFETATRTLTGLQQQMETTAQTGHTELITMLRSADSALRDASGSSSNLTGQFTRLEKRIGENGKAMRALQVENTWLQAGLAVAQYDDQLRIANRSLRDAVSFQTGLGSGELGLLQYRARNLDISAAQVGFMQQELGLQSQQLGMQSSALSIRSRELALMQNQRQINFQLAVAGFAAPGVTPEERAARMEEAKLQADFAQQQQNIGVEGLGVDRQQVALQAQQVALAGQGLAIAKEQFAVQQAMITVSTAYAIEDLNAQIALLQQARDVTLRVTLNTEEIEAFQEQIAADMATTQSIIQDAYNVYATVSQSAAALAAAYPGTLAAFNSALLTGLNNYLTGAFRLMSGYSSGSSWSSGTGGSNTSTSYKGPTATGYYGTVNTATQFTVGEAGTETVAIIRNPRNLTMNPEGTGGGGGVTVIVDVHDNTLSGSQSDLESLATIVAGKVEQKLGERARAMGLGLSR